MSTNKLYTLGIACFASLGTFLYVREHPNGVLLLYFNSIGLQGYDTGIVSTSKYIPSSLSP